MHPEYSGKRDKGKNNDTVIGVDAAGHKGPSERYEVVTVHSGAVALAIENRERQLPFFPFLSIPK